MSPQAAEPDIKNTGLRIPLKIIVKAGLTAGTLDAMAAVANYLIATSGKSPVKVFQFIASGVFGAEAFAGGLPMALVGVFFHYAIASSWTAVFFFTYPRAKVFSKNLYATGTLYGLVIWLVMNLIVLPLSNVPQMQLTFVNSLLGVAILMACVGIPVSLIIGRYYVK